MTIKDANSISNIEHTDKTAPLGAEILGCTVCLDQSVQNLRSLGYAISGFQRIIEDIYQSCT